MSRAVLGWASAKKLGRIGDDAALGGFGGLNRGRRLGGRGGLDLVQGADAGQADQ
jgi:hypothetical protein